MSGEELERRAGIQIAEAARGLREDIAQLRATQENLLAGFKLMLDTLGAHTEMLKDVLGAARQEQGPSEVVAALDELTAAVQQNNDTLQTLGDALNALPGEIGAEIARASAAQSVQRTPL
jgi:hypothetical protein